MPGAFKLDHLQPFAPLTFSNYTIFFTFILGGQFLLPQRANNGKREFSQPQKWMRQWVFSASDIHTGPFVSLYAYFALKVFQLFHLHTGEPILITQKANHGKREFFQLQNWMRQRGFSAWGIQTGPFAALCTSHILKLYHLFHLHTGGPILITPEG